MTNESMINVLDNVKTKDIYECIKEPEPVFKDINFDGAEYNYDNVISQEVNLKEVVTLNLFKTINSMNNKLINGRIKDKDAEKIRIDYLKTYVSACNCFINLVSKGNVNTHYDKDKLKEFINLNDAIFNDD